ncbi:MAG: nucleotidyltransferase domain-containing protein [Verrucomicrobiota bacterium]
MEALQKLETHAEEFRKLGAKRIGVFGSASRGEENEVSDLDVYLEFEEGMRTFRNFIGIHELLEQLFQRSIDLVTDRALSERKAKIILPTVRYASLC